MVKAKAVAKPKTKVKKAPVKAKAVVKAKPKKVAKTTKKPVKKVVKKTPVVKAKKKVVAPKRVATPRVNQAEISAKIRNHAILYNRDLDMLGNGFWADLDLACFRSVMLNGIHMDLVYSSDATAIVVKVLSDDEAWTVDTKTGVWKNAVMEEGHVVEDLLKQRTLLKKVEPKARITPIVLLMRGSVNNELEVQKYLLSKGIMLVKYNSSVHSKAPVLIDMLKTHFVPVATPMVSDAEWKDGTESSPAKSKGKLRKTIHNDGIFNQKEKAAMASAIATVAHAGYFPKGSGTIGSVIALPIAYILNQTCLGAVWIFCFVTFFLGIWAINRFTQNKVEKDPSSVIIDEVVGQTLPFAFVVPDLLHWQFLLLGFLAFRFFDIFKFGLVKYFDRQKNAWGVMMDDVIAGLEAAIVLLIAQALLIL